MTGESLSASSAARPPDGAVAAEAAHRHDLDLLRVLLVFGLVFFHTARIFDTLPLPEGVKNNTTSPLVTLIVVSCALWAMPLMFVIAGFSIRHSLRKRSAAAFLRDRAQRLLVPLIFGVLVVVPPQVYVHLLQADPAAELPYWQFLPRFFDVRLCPDLFGLICANPASGLFTMAHLWFLGDLFLFSLLLLPLFWYLQRPSGERRLSRSLDALARPGAIWLLALPIVLFDVVFGAAANGGWKHQTFALFLLCGYLVAADGRLAKAMGRSWRSALAVALLLTALYALGAFYLSDVAHVDPTRDYDWGSLSWRALKSVGAWAWMIAILGFGSRPRGPRRLPGSPDPPRASSLPDGRAAAGRRTGARLIAYAGEAFLPFYILHQTIVFVIGYYVVAWELAPAAKYLVISLATLATTLFAYDLAVRRTAVTRWLFGMRPAR
jgi:surface polysaccharide O-acyltransferase-like enzyme